MVYHLNGSSPLMTIKKTIALLAAASTSLALVACSDSSSDDSASSDGGSSGGDNYILVNGTEPQNPLVPANTNETGGGRIVDSLFSGLVGYDAEGETYNEVAESIEANADKIEYTIELNWVLSSFTSVVCVTSI